MVHVPIPHLPGRWDPTFRANPHLHLVWLAVPFLFVAIYYHAEWAAWMAAGIWVVVFLLHLFIGKKPSRRDREKDVFGQKRFYH